MTFLKEERTAMREALARLKADYPDLHKEGIPVERVLDTLELTEIRVERLEAERNWLASYIAKKEFQTTVNAWRDIKSPIFSQAYWLELAARKVANKEEK